MEEIYRSMQQDVRECHDVDCLSFMKEMELLHQLIYRNVNQHRRTVYFRHLREAYKEYKSLKVREVFQGMLLQGLECLSICQLDATKHHVSWKVLDGELKQRVDMVLSKLTLFIEQCEKTLAKSEKAYQSFASQLAMSYFMSFALTANSMLARLYTLTRMLCIRAVELHHSLGISYLAQVSRANPLRAQIVAQQLRAYTLSSTLLESFERKASTPLED